MGIHRPSPHCFSSGHPLTLLLLAPLGHGGRLWAKDYLQEIVNNVLCLCFCLSYMCTHMYTCICVYRAGIFTSSWDELWDPEAFYLAEQSSEQDFDKSCLWALVHRPSDTVVFISRSQDPSPLRNCCPSEGSQDQTLGTWMGGTCAPTCRGLRVTVLWGRRQLQRALTMLGTGQTSG